MRRVWAVVWIGVLGCDRFGLGDDKDADGPPVPIAQCPASVWKVFPEDGEERVFFRTAVRFSVDGADGTEEITVIDENGVEVEGETTVEGQTVSWTGPDLRTDARYDVILSYACGEATTSWTTSDAGEPLVASPEGRTYALRLGDGEWRETWWGEHYLMDHELVVSVAEVRDGELSLELGVIYEGTLARPARVVPVPAAATDGPFVEASSRRPLQFTSSPAYVLVETPSFAGTFAPGADRLEGGTFTGLLNTHIIERSFYPEWPQGWLCEDPVFAGAGCVPCPKSGEPVCMPVRIENLSGVHRPDLADVL